MSEQMKYENESVKIDNPDYKYTDGNNTTEIQNIEQPNTETTTETKFGNAILSAADRINGLIGNSVDKYREAKESLNDRKEIAKEKLKKIGISALDSLQRGGKAALKFGVDTAEITLALGVLGAQAVGRGVENISDKISTAADNTRYLVEAGIDRTKDAIDDKRGQISGAYDDAKEKVNAKIDSIQDDIADKLDSANRYIGGKVESVAIYLINKKDEASERKQARADKREQKRGEKEAQKAEYAQQRAEAEERRQARRATRSEARQERVQNSKDILRGIGIISLDFIKTAKEAGRAARTGESMQAA